MKLVIETNLVRLIYHFTSHYFHFYSSLKQLYTSNKMERFSYRGGGGVHGHSMHLKEELAKPGLDYR